MKKIVNVLIILILLFSFSICFADLVPVRKVLDIKPGLNGTVNPEARVDFFDDSREVKITYTADKGYVVGRILLDDKEVTPNSVSKDGGTKKEVTIKASDITHGIHTIIAEYTINPIYLSTVTVRADDNLIVETNISDYEVSEGTTKYHVKAFDTFDITVKAKDGYRIESCTADGVELLTTGNYTREITRRYTSLVDDISFNCISVKTDFDNLKVVGTITVSIGQHGSFFISALDSLPSNSHESKFEFKEGSNKNIKVGFTGNTGFVPSQIMVDGEPAKPEGLAISQDGGTICIYEFLEVVGDHTISCEFKKGGMYTPTRKKITISTDSFGSTTPTGVNEVTEGDDFTVRFAAKEGFVLDQIFVDGNETNYTSLSKDGGTQGTLTLKDISKDHLISITFKRSSISPTNAPLTTPSSTKWPTPTPNLSNKHTVIIQSDTNGFVTPSGNIEVGDGGEVSVAFVGKTGYVLNQIRLDGVLVNYTSLSKDGGTRGTYVLENVKKNHTIVVTFKQQATVTDQPIPTYLPTYLASDWAKAEMQKADNEKLIPNRLITSDLRSPVSRVEFASICMSLYDRIHGNSDFPNLINPFTDTNDVDAIKAYYLGVTKGVSENEFNPESRITREQMSTMLDRLITILGLNYTLKVNLTFADANNVSDWAKDGVARMALLGLIQGVGDNTFLPQGEATREQALAISLRTVEKFLK